MRDPVLGHAEFDAWERIKFGQRQVGSLAVKPHKCHVKRAIFGSDRTACEPSNGYEGKA